MKLHDMKRPKPKKKDMTAEAVPYESDRYPYGLELNFEAEEVSKIPSLKNLTGGEKVKIVGEGKVTGIRINDTTDGSGKAENSHSVTIQLQSIGVASKEDYDGAWDEDDKKKD